MTAVEPASTGGRDSIDTLASQAVSRLQGEPVADLTDSFVLAFNFVAVEPEDLAEDAALLLRRPWSAHRAMVGCFHGHVAQVLIDLADELDDARALELIESEPALELHELPLALDAVPDTDSILVTPPRVVSGGRRVALTAMVDGLRIGGAITASEILENLA